MKKQSKTTTGKKDSKNFFESKKFKRIAHRDGLNIEQLGKSNLNDPKPKAKSVKLMESTIGRPLTKKAEENIKSGKWYKEIVRPPSGDDMINVYNKKPSDSWPHKNEKTTLRSDLKWYKGIDESFGHKWNDETKQQYTRWIKGGRKDDVWLEKEGADLLKTMPNLKKVKSTDKKAPKEYKKVKPLSQKSSNLAIRYKNPK